ncbi:hypothetical protein DFH44_005267 [Clostridium beijerinckii]|uniref:hypothetical protein n=1 Tax=Clostridium beijerinckii TaxID=1520 RepID=UPI001F4BF3ED|nr:hypothetical protein [Clostridium beijerinckii]NRU85227.1 hypothetical protein [Clostridium beijerinckii]
MDELLNLLKVKLCNCTIKDEEIIKIKAYIESGANSLNLEEFNKYNMEKALRSHYNIRADFWKLMDGFIEKEEIFKRIINVFFVMEERASFK